METWNLEKVAEYLQDKGLADDAIELLVGELAHAQLLTF